MYRLSSALVLAKGPLWMLTLLYFYEIISVQLSIEELHVTSSMTSPMIAAMLEVFFRAARDVLMEITLENRRK
jgi:hypothetical protein